MDEATQGTPFPVQFLLNKPLSEIQTLNFYYTTSLGNPTQNPAVPYISSPGSPPGGAAYAYLPVVPRESNPGALLFSWDTSGVSPGQYYLCAQAWDGYNQTTYCSKAPVDVVLP